jgi:hypothetical protein
MKPRLYQVKASRGARTSASASPTVAGWAQPAQATHPTVGARSLPRVWNARPNLRRPSRSDGRSASQSSLAASPSFPAPHCCITLYKRRTPALVFPLCLSHPDQESQHPSSPGIWRNSKLAAGNSSICCANPSVLLEFDLHSLETSCFLDLLRSCARVPC